MKPKQFIEKEYKRFYPIFVKILGKDTTYEKDLKRVAKKLFGDKFKGLYARDDIQMKNIESNGYYIINTGTRKQGGEHWCAIADNLFFDSFGRTSNKLGFGNYKNTEEDHEQTIDELTCGAHSMCFLYLYQKYGEEFCKYI